MKKLSRLAALGAQRMGIAISRYPTYLSLEHHLQELVPHAGIEIVIDVGAHHGEFRDLLRNKCSYQGRIVSFEPASEAYSHLENIRDARWDRHKLALGSSNGEATLHLYGSSVFNSVLTPSGFALDLFDLSDRGTEQVSMRRLDDALSDLGIDLSAQPAFVKIDTQGGDRSVIAGAPEALRAAVILQTEMSLLRIYEGAPAFLGALAEVIEFGFDITGLFPVTRDRQHRIIEVDCVLRRVNPADGNLLTT